MNAIFNKIISAFWIFDIMNLPFMEMFDTTYPINFWEYFILLPLWWFLPSISVGFNEGGGNSGKDNSNS